MKKLSLIIVLLSVFISLLVSCQSLPTTPPSPPQPIPSSSVPSSPSTPVPGAPSRPTEVVPPPGVLSPSQIDSSLIDRGMKVMGKVLVLIENPGGQGGAYAKLSDGKGEVGLRIEPATWSAYTSEEKSRFTQGKTVTVEGRLVLAGQELVVVMGVIPPTPPGTPGPGPGNATFVVKVPENTALSYAVFMELVDEQSKLLGFVKMEPQDPVTWRVSIPAGPKKFGYRYTRDGIGFPTAEEFTPDSAKTFRWPSPSPGMVINDVVTQWRWFAKPGYIMPVVQSVAGTASIAKRINNQEFQCGYQFVDFWWTPFHDLVHGTNVAMKKANGSWMKIAPPIGFTQVEPVPKMNWEIIPDNPIYPPGELEYQISQAQKDGLNIFLNPQCGVLNGPLQLDADKQYSDEWWDAYLKEMEQYATYFATLAEKCGVKYLAFQDNEMWNSLKAPKNIQQKYSDYIANIRRHYSGQLGMVLSLGGSYRSPADLFPVGYFPEKFDFLALGGPQKITDSKQPNVNEMKANFKKILEAAIEPLYTKYQKPIILYSAGYPSLDGGASRDFTHDDPAMDVFEAYSDKYQLDLVEQAEVYEALIQVVAETPYITGFYLFNSYWPTPLPLSKFYGVWGKPAEQIMSGWYQRFQEALK
jgi:hypothetical protein